MKDVIKIAKMVALFGQLGFTIVTPPVVMALLGYWLQERFSLGGWVMLAAILLGLAASASGVYRYYRRVTALTKKEKKTENVIYYRHE